MTTKAAAALEIYNALKAANDPDIRKKFIARCKDELGMGDAGAATYYQTTKTKAEGGTPKVYGKAASKASSKAASAEVNSDPWSVIQIKEDKVFDCAVFIGEQAARDAFDKLNDNNKEICEVIQGTLPVGSPYVLGA